MKWRDAVKASLDTPCTGLCGLDVTLDASALVSYLMNAAVAIVGGLCGAWWPLKRKREHVAA